jgi:hypothetical protein
LNFCCSLSFAVLSWGPASTNNFLGGFHCFLEGFSPSWIFHFLVESNLILLLLIRGSTLILIDVLKKNHRNSQ